MDPAVVSGIVVTAVASVFFATGATLQHHAIGGIVDTGADNRSMGLAQLWRMLRTPRWLIGLAIITLGALGHLWGLTFAPVTVVQPVGVLAVPWSVLMASRLHGHRVSGAMWRAVAITIVGIVGFTWFSATNAAPERVPEPTVVLVGAVVVWVAGFGFGMLGWRGRSALWRSLWWASGGSFFYGLTSALFKSLHQLWDGPGRLPAWPGFWVLIALWIASYAIGGVMIQQAYACGPAEVVVGSMDTTDPIVAVGFGLIVLGEGVRIGPLEAVAMIALAAVAVAGVVLLSRNHPHAVGAGPTDPGGPGVAQAAGDLRRPEPS